MLLGISLNPISLLVLGLVVLLVFGKRLPELMKGLGKSVTEFKKGINDNSDEDGPSKS